MAISADSKAMDMPLPVTGGVIVSASPMQHSAKALYEASRKASRTDCRGVVPRLRVKIAALPLHC